jgi:uncharacterized protein YdeI (YjbR/CyaY-like superfamily)
LDTNHNKSDGLWLRIFKKGSGKASVTYQEALDHALCYGWIDGQKKAYDEHSWLQKFAPRRAQSTWSKINTERAEHLINVGQMQQAGLEAVEVAKADGRWQAAYDSPSNASIPEDFLKELAKSKRRKHFSKRQIKQTSMPSFIGSKRQRSQKPEKNACGSSWR